MLEEIHSHLVRSPPPIAWPPISPRSSAGPFSPDSESDNNDYENKCNNRIGNISITGPLPGRTLSPTTLGGQRQFDRSELVNRCHSEEHILSPTRDTVKKALFSPTRGATPDYLNNGMNKNYSTQSFNKQY